MRVCNIDVCPARANDSEFTKKHYGLLTRPQAAEHGGESAYYFVPGSLEFAGSTRGVGIGLRELRLISTGPERGAVG